MAQDVPVYPAKAVPTAVEDIYHVFGNDLELDETGDLLTVSGSEMGKQRILRRLLTSINGYIWHPDYGAGLGAFVGQALTDDLFVKIKNLIRSQIFLEDSVAKNPPPEILLQSIQTGIFCQINYTDKPSQTPVILTFNVSQ